MNRYVSERYFTDGANATIGNFELFKIRKAKNTIRLFVLGESTTIGYPYMHNGSFHRWLSYRLAQMYPDWNFEIINLSLTAVNSYTVLDLAKELPNYEPDGILIYSGHNEYYGALGVGSTSKLGNSPWLIQTLIGLKHLRVVQLIFNTMRGLSGKGKTDTSQTLMERMAADQHIPYGSEKFNNGIAQFKTNINEVCRLFSVKEIPVFISNLVSNEKDLQPLNSYMKEAETSAKSYYDKGAAAYRISDTLAAKRLFIKAAAHDQLRFRAPEQMNEIISNAASRYAGVYLVDTRKIFEEHSQGHILGNETILEHVHPNLLGYSLMSEVFFSALKIHHILPADPQFQMSLRQLQDQMPLTAVDSLFGTYSVVELKKAWPFQETTIKHPIPNTFEGEIAMAMIKKRLPWNEAMDRLMNFYEHKKDQKHELKVAEAVVLEYPQDAGFCAAAGKLYALQSNLNKAINYFHRAFVLEPSMDLARVLFALEIKNRQPEKAENYINYALTVNPDNQILLNAQAIVKQLIHLEQARRTAPADSEISKQLNDTYASLQQN
ncbi:GDSL-like Lipase/Acylhydrolase family protein [Mucilaginibacter pineti]|uniref:GDSL-like Lipase/Acylhydrolase family protein n=2 Tax=Mucilaginibacter pineti TaxID=1391627 RepID=A0A1G6U1U3_9SPHI|nr:GDSL-like Lipase/Acylhydrolase family protein [Mucilaginibacter pineti]